MLQKTYLQSILSYFTSMDIANLRLYLKEEYSYQETTQEIFLNEIEEIFEAHKNSGDTELLIYKGACGSDGRVCENCGKKGYRFVGNHSKNYLDLLFETEGDDIKDIYYCERFKTEENISNLGSGAYISIDLDERVTFIKTPEYWAKVNSASAAYSEMITNPPRQLSFEELSYWVDKHAVLNGNIGNYDVFEPSMKWSPFSILYAGLRKIRSYIYKHLKDLIIANYLTNELKTEQDLIDWVLKYESIHEEASFDLMYSFVKDGENYRLNNRNPIIFKGEEFTETFSFIEYYQENNENFLKKYKIYTNEEESKLQGLKGPHKELNDIFSLRFHIERRKVLEEQGIHIPFYLGGDNDQLLFPMPLVKQ